MGLSEEQKKDLKFKLYVAGTLLVIVIPILMIGPFLPRFISKYEKTPTHPDSSKRMLLAIQIQANTMRAPEARKNLETWITLFVDETEYDFSEVVGGTSEYVMMKYDYREGLLEEGFTPWLFPEGHPPAVKAASAEEVGQALDLYAKLLEDDREYPRAAHIFVCLVNMWAKDSPAQLAGYEGYTRCNLRSF